MVQNRLEQYDGVKQFMNQCTVLVNRYDKLILFGASRTGEKVYTFLESISQLHKLRMIVDNDEGKYHQYFQGHLIHNRSELLEYLRDHPDCLVMVASGSAHIIIRQLISEGVPKACLEPFPFGFLQVDPTPYEYFTQHKDEIAAVADQLSDAKSREVFYGIINYKMTRHQEYLSTIADEEDLQYFGDGFFLLGQDEYIVDCGAYIGDTLEQFHRKLNGWARYTCLEADKDVYRRLVEYSAKNNYENVQLVHCGCWSEDGFMSFEATGSETGRINDAGNETVQTRSVDSLFPEEKVTFIKMDIEGAEAFALQGAQKVIRESRPILAISIYHSMDDLIQIPKYLMNNLMDYNFYIRHYREMSDSETIIYAVPEERSI